MLAWCAPKPSSCMAAAVTLVFLITLVECGRGVLADQEPPGS